MNIRLMCEAKHSGEFISDRVTLRSKEKRHIFLETISLGSKSFPSLNTYIRERDGFHHSIIVPLYTLACI